MRRTSVDCTDASGWWERFRAQTAEGAQGVADAGGSLTIDVEVANRLTQTAAPTV